ncbi:MAG: TIGR01777 family oxidoreductase [Pseudomonadota bacterium]
MKVFITGGTGFVGSGLVEAFSAPGREILLLTRAARGKKTPPGVRLVEGDPVRPGAWEKEAAGAEVVVNLAGASIFQRWNPAIKKEIMESRVRTTRRLVEVMSAAPLAGRVFLSASAVGWYGPRADEELDESCSPGGDFLAQVAGAWEDEAFKAREAGARTAVMRFGVVLEPRGGALGKMLPLFRLGLGGRLGGGRQWFSWIHRADLVRAAVFLAENRDAQGVFNFTSPQPVRNSEFTATLARVLGRPAFLPVPAFALKLVLGEFSETLLKGQKVLPRGLFDLGFKFTYPDLEAALRAGLGPGKTD